MYNVMRKDEGYKKKEDVTKKAEYILIEIA